MKLNKILIAIMVLACAMTAKAQEPVTNIRITQKDKMVQIKYDLLVNAEVKVQVSMDDGETYTDTMSMSGYLNRVYPAGRNYSIRWNAFKNLGYGDHPNIRIKFITKEKPANTYNKTANKRQANNRRPQKNTFITLNGAYTNTEVPSVGLTFEQVKSFGWFVSVMSGFHFAGLTPDAKADADGFVESDLPFYKDEYAKTALSIMGGGVMRISDNVFAKAGLGFGNRSISWKTLDDQWVRQKDYSAVGVDFSLGMMFKLGNFIISLDGVTTNFNIYEGRLGLGYSFINR